MALLHRAELRPTKLELLATWLPGRVWYRGDADAEVVRVGAYRFDDPAGEVGIETLLVRAGTGPVHQVPLTYRGEPLAGAEEWLVGTMEHSALGRRWVYDACGDPVYVAALADAVLADTGQAEEYFEEDGERQVRPPNMEIASDAPASEAPPVGAVRSVADGDLAVIATDGVELAVVRRPGSGATASGVALIGTWDDVSAPLAYAVPR
ncbi:CG0192-related protein [Micromonospora sp. NPDC049900]|uniref:CG0192-related protein n=1 Tax=unclassified Micromonospora TaxID=2617518 RepID=UPI0037BC3BAB